MREAAVQIVNRLQKAGFDALWVGGCVRDELIGRTPHDYDIATSAVPDEIECLFARTIPVGRQFGVMIVFEAGHSIHVATFRADSNYEDGRHPDQVRFCDAETDAQRRDFTINGLFFDPVKKIVHDWVGGRRDLLARIIRTIGPPEERFREDHLRLLRAVRFAAELDFEVENGTLEVIRNNADLIQNVSAERIREELVRLFAPPHASRGLVLLKDSGLLRSILPELEACTNCDQSPEFHPEGNVYNHLVRMLEFLPRDASTTLVWSALLHDVGKPATASRDRSGSIHFYGHEKEGAEIAIKILNRFKFSRRQSEDILECVRNHMHFKDVPNMRRATVRRLLLRPTFPLELELHRLDCLGSHGRLDTYHSLRREAEALAEQPQWITPWITGRDLIELGMKPGPQMGRLLKAIRTRQLQGDFKDRTEAKHYAAQAVQTVVFH